MGRVGKRWLAFFEFVVWYVTESVKSARRK